MRFFDKKVIPVGVEEDWNLSKSTKLNDAKTVDPGKVEIIPRKRVTLHVRTCCWAQTETKKGKRKNKFLWNCLLNCGIWRKITGNRNKIFYLRIYHLTKYQLLVRYALKMSGIIGDLVQQFPCKNNYKNALKKFLSKNNKYFKSRI